MLLKQKYHLGAQNICEREVDTYRSRCLRYNKAMKKCLVVAVSGGVDSVVLLDLLANSQFPTLNLRLIVAHFDHGIRDDSAQDARFVADLAHQYGMQFETKREQLGAGASEDVARKRRYAFLRSVAEKYDAPIVTAHHMNDCAETIAINLLRGTGWRGVAVLASDDIVRPLLGRTKTEIIAYAKKHQLKWREDSTNASDAYLRNRLRPLLTDDDLVRQLAALRSQQVQLRDGIEDALDLLDLRAPFERYFFTMIDVSVAHECLRRITHRALTRPQQQAALLAIATYRAGQKYEAGAGVTLCFSTRHFTLEDR